MSFTAQPNGPRGLSPTKPGRFGGTPQRSVDAEIAGTYGTKIYRGQPVKVDANGQIIVLAAATDAVFGVFDGCEYYDTQGNVIFSPYWPAPGAVQTGSVVKARVYPAEGGLFEIFADGDIVQTDIGLYTRFTAVIGGDDTTGQSSIAADESAATATITNETVRILERGSKPGDARSIVVSFIRPQFAADQE